MWQQLWTDGTPDGRPSDDRRAAQGEGAGGTPLPSEYYCHQASNPEVRVQDEDVVRLRAAIGRIARRLDRQASDEGRPRTQLSILATVAVREAIGISELAEIE